MHDMVPAQRAVIQARSGCFDMWWQARMPHPDRPESRKVARRRSYASRDGASITASPVMTTRSPTMQRVSSTTRRRA